MTFVEFLAQLKKSTNQAKVLAVLYFKERYESTPGLTTEQIKQALKLARVPNYAKINLSDVLNKAGPLVDTTGLAGASRLWSLTETGRQEVRDLANLPASDPEVEHDVKTLRDLVARVPDADVKDYLEEAIKCFQVGALRAGVVFVWSAVIRTIQYKVLGCGEVKANDALKTHYQRAKHVSNVDHFAYIDDSITLLAAKDLGLYDKNEAGILKEALDLRNKCGHPGKYRPGIKKVSSLLEDVVSVVLA
jgi:hypothetical protein